MDRLIILIGPISAGKTTIGKLLAEQLGLPQIPLDDLRSKYYPELGYDHAHAEALREEQGLDAMLRYWKPFELHAVERVLKDYSEGVLDFGAGHSVYEDDAHFERAARALAPYPHVILLLPSPDLAESVRCLNERMGEELQAIVGSLNEHFITHHSNHDLAKHTIYTLGKTAEETCAEIITLIGASPRPTRE